MAQETRKLTLSPSQYTEFESFRKDLQNCYWQDYNEKEFNEIVSDVERLISDKGGIDYQCFPPTFRWHLCAARLKQGKFDNWDGWEYRSNWSITFQGWNGYQMKVPKWNGKPVKHLVIASEQGIGDEICYASAIPELIVRLGHEPLELQCHPRLIPVFERSYRIKCTPRKVLSEVTEGDAVVALADLFMFYRRDKTHFPKKPFLKVNPDLKAKWQFKLDGFPKPWIGLSWKSRHGEIDVGRILNGLTGTFFNLQYGDSGNKLSVFGDKVLIGLDCDPMVDMDDHLALVSCMDKVVSVTQTLCHEAGALGVPCEAIKPPKGSGDVDCILWYYGNGGSHLIYGNQKVFNSLEDWLCQR